MLQAHVAALPPRGVAKDGPGPEAETECVNHHNHRQIQTNNVAVELATATNDSDSDSDGEPEPDEPDSGPETAEPSGSTDHQVRTSSQSGMPSVRSRAVPNSEGERTSMFNLSTVWVGDIAVVRREDQHVTRVGFII